MADLSSLINLECEPNSGEAWLETATALFEQHVAAIAGCIDAYKQRIAELEAKVPRWIPMEERRPRPTEPILYLHASGVYEGIGGSLDEATHWMPRSALPSPPAEPAQEEVKHLSIRINALRDAKKLIEELITGGKTHG